MLSAAQQCSVLLSDTQCCSVLLSAAQCWWAPACSLQLGAWHGAQLEAAAVLGLWEVPHSSHTFLRVML